MKNCFYFLLICFLTICYGCSLLFPTQEKELSLGSIISNGSEQLAHIYNPVSTSIHPKIFIRKNNLEDVELFVVINDSELLFSKANAQNKSTAKVRIFYKIMESFENIAAIDTATKVLTLSKSDTPKTYAVKLKLKPVEQKKFVLQTTVTDLLRGKMNINFSIVDKTDSLCADNFALSKIENMQPFSENYFKKGDVTRIDYNFPKLDTVYKLFFSPSTEIPAVPYASDPVFIDTLDFSNAEILNRNFLVNASEEGYFYFTADTLSRNGLVIPCFSEDYPNISRLDKMIEPLAYLTTPQEYDSIKNSNHKKLAIDDFWLSCTSDSRRAKDLLKVFYTRAVFANIYFPDYRDGVLTDRGMIYIVLGPPKILGFTSDSEIWIYKDSHSGKKVRFTFSRSSDAMTKQKYVLQRNTEFKPYWDAAVNSWRKGMIYSW